VDERVLIGLHHGDLSIYRMMDDRQCERVRNEVSEMLLTDNILIT
jgi:hypothetical protein